MAEPRSHTGHFLRRVLPHPVPAPEHDAAPPPSTARPKAKAGARKRA